MLHQSSLHCSSPFKISLFCMTAVLHGSQSPGRRGGRAAEWTHGRWLPASGCLARTGQEGRVLLQDSTVLPLHVSNSACYVPAVTQLFYTITVELNRLFWSQKQKVCLRETKFYITLHYTVPSLFLPLINKHVPSGWVRSMQSRPLPSQE